MVDSRHRSMRKQSPTADGLKRMRGFWYAVRTYLKPVQHGMRPDPSSVYRVLSNKRQSRSLIVNIFENCPELLEHPKTSSAVKAIYAEWSVSGALPEKYGRKRGEMESFGE